MKKSIFKVESMRLSLAFAPGCFVLKQRLQMDRGGRRLGRMRWQWRRGAALRWTCLWRDCQSARWPQTGSDVTGCGNRMSWCRFCFKSVL